MSPIREISDAWSGRTNGPAARRVHRRAAFRGRLWPAWRGSVSWKHERTDHEQSQAENRRLGRATVAHHLRTGNQSDRSSRNLALNADLAEVAHDDVRSPIPGKDVFEFAFKDRCVPVNEFRGSPAGLREFRLDGSINHLIDNLNVGGRKVDDRKPIALPQVGGIDNRGLSEREAVPHAIVQFDEYRFLVSLEVARPEKFFPQ